MDLIRIQRKNISRVSAKSDRTWDDILVKHQELFDGKPSELKRLLGSLELKENSKRKARPVPFSLQPKVEEAIQRAVRDGSSVVPRAMYGGGLPDAVADSSAFVSNGEDLEGDDDNSDPHSLKAVMVNQASWSPFHEQDEDMCSKARQRRRSIFQDRPEAPEIPEWIQTETGHPPGLQETVDLKRTLLVLFHELVLALEDTAPAQVMSLLAESLHSLIFPMGTQSDSYESSKESYSVVKSKVNRASLQHDLRHYQGLSTHLTSLKSAVTRILFKISISRFPES
ncbi:unnamed protein product [Cyprideis torosa]|uniref:Uncharacterized protein n=1 Tax=Cyprideis torosa TaxID=163714 RepID=A0A7R8ZQN9_9CRUS|nr:unnamed protein product [Cyprideis torosa]CAG0901837.1 unnamed protein product [Cyprideis torosa]